MKTDRYKGQIVLPEISIEGQRKISQSCVAVVGLGGTGSMAAELLNRMGVGSLILIDGDRVRESNLQRQILYGESSIGKAKVDAARERLSEENSETGVTVYPEFLEDANSGKLLAGANLIYDGTDNVMARHTINRASIRQNIPWIMNSAIEYYGQVKAVVPGRTSCLSCINYPVEEAVVSCSEQGIFPPVLAWTSSLGVALAVSAILGKEVSGDFTHIDMRTMEMKRFSAARNPDCPVCSGLH